MILIENIGNSLAIFTVTLRYWLVTDGSGRTPGPSELPNHPCHYGWNGDIIGEKRHLLEFIEVGGRSECWAQSGHTEDYCNE